MAEQEEPISGKEYKVITKALFELLAACEKLPAICKVKYQGLDAEESIGLNTLPGAKYLEKHIDGSFVAQVPFQTLYKVKATSNGQLMDSQIVIDDICDWLEETEVPQLTDNRRIVDITMNSTTYVTDKDESGYVVYARTGILQYEMEE